MQEHNIPKSAAPWEVCKLPWARFRVSRRQSLLGWHLQASPWFTSTWKVPFSGPGSEHPSWLSAIPWTSWYWYLLEISKSTHPSPNPDHLPPSQLLHLTSVPPLRTLSLQAHPVPLPVAPPSPLSIWAAPTVPFPFALTATAFPPVYSCNNRALTGLLIFHTLLSSLNIFWLYHMVCGILVPQPGIKLVSPALQEGILTTETPEKSPAILLESGLFFVPN